VVEDGWQRLKTRSVSVNLTPRQYGALRAYCSAVDASMSAYVRAIVAESIPPQYWEREPAPPGQLELVEQ
jgi:hypothetical protein